MKKLTEIKQAMQLAVAAIEHAEKGAEFLKPENSLLAAARENAALAMLQVYNLLSEHNDKRPSED